MFVVTLIAPGDEEAVVEAEVRAVAYFLDHPYLEIGPAAQGLSLLLDAPGFGRRSRSASRRRTDELRAEQAALGWARRGVLRRARSIAVLALGSGPGRYEGRPTLITYTFIHAGFLHLLGNLFIFYLVGPALEDAWGRPLFAALLSCCPGVAAALVFVARYPDLMEPLIGASGAIAGVMGAFAVRYWNSRITFVYFVWMIRIYRGTFSAPAWLMLGLWALGELAFAMGIWAFFSIADLGDVGFLAHVGGFVFGVGLRLSSRLAADRGAIRRTGLMIGTRRCTTRRRSRGISSLRDAGAPRRRVTGSRGVSGRATRTMPMRLRRCGTSRLRAGVPSRAIPAVLPAHRGGGSGRRCGAARSDLGGDRAASHPRSSSTSEWRPEWPSSSCGRGCDGDVETTLDWLAGRVDASTPEGLLIRLARLAARLSVPAPFAALALDRPDLAPDLAGSSFRA